MVLALVCSDTRQKSPRLVPTLTPKRVPWAVRSGLPPRWNSLTRWSRNSIGPPRLCDEDRAADHDDDDRDRSGDPRDERDRLRGPGRGGTRPRGPGGRRGPPSRSSSARSRARSRASAAPAPAPRHRAGRRRAGSAGPGAPAARRGRGTSRPEAGVGTARGRPPAQWPRPGREPRLSASTASSSSIVAVPTSSARSCHGSSPSAARAITGQRQISRNAALGVAVSDRESKRRVGVEEGGNVGAAGQSDADDDPDHGPGRGNGGERDQHPPARAGCSSRSPSRKSAA